MIKIDSLDLPIAEAWYGVESHPGGITRVYEKYLDPYYSGSIWVISGTDRDLVVDTGTGIVPLAPFISTISGKALTAVALCHYYDHAGGMYSFDARACHRLEAEALSHPSKDWIDFGFIQDSGLSALPWSDFKINDYSRKPATPTQILEDDDVIDIGGRQLRALHIPGRTSGSLALWEENTGYLFGGETLFIDPNDYDFPPENTACYESSLRKLAKLPVTTVFGGHYGSFSGEELQHLIAHEIGRYI